MTIETQSEFHGGEYIRGESTVTNGGGRRAVARRVSVCRAFHRVAVYTENQKLRDQSGTHACLSGNYGAFRAAGRERGQCADYKTRPRVGSALAETSETVQLSSRVNVARPRRHLDLNIVINFCSPLLFSLFSSLPAPLRGGGCPSSARSASNRSLQKSGMKPGISPSEAIK